MITTSISHFTQTIRAQIGVGALMAVGARDFAYSDKDGARYLQFKVTGQRAYWTTVRVTLEANDTYTVELLRTHKRTLETEAVRTFDLVYCDSLALIVRTVCGES